MSASKPRPIHTLTREIREIPDQSEPSYSYEDDAFGGDLVVDKEDEFHRRMAVTNPKRDSAGGGGTGSGSSVGGSNVAGSGNFWRTDIAPTLPSKPVTLKERKSSGGLLGAALQLHSQSSTISDDKGPAKKTAGMKAGSHPDQVRFCPILSCGAL
jgi:hypothetical protein